MRVTTAMIQAAKRAEFDYYQGAGLLGQKFVPTPDAVVRKMLQAALGDDAPQKSAQDPSTKIGRIVTARPPPKRGR